MKSSFALIGTVVLSFILFCSSITSNSFFVEGSVVEISGRTNFKSFVEENPISIIKFFAPWCGHCKKIAPLWEEYGNMENLGYPVARVDCTTEDNRPVCSEAGIRGYPTILVYTSNGETLQHQAMRTIPEFQNTVKLAQEQFLSPPTPTPTSEEVKVEGEVESN